MRGRVFKRRPEDAQWSATVDVGRENGKRKQKMQTNKFKSEREAWKWVRETLSAVEKQEYVPPSDLTVGDYLKEWLPGVKSQVKPSTWESYRSYTERHLIPSLGAIRLQDLKPGHLKALYGELKDGGRKDGGQGGLSTRSIRYIHAIVRLALRDAVTEGRLQRNVALLVKPPKLVQGEMKAWTGPEAQTFLAHVKDDRLFAAWALALSTGMRKGEILGLRWSDVDLECSKLTVNQTLISIGHKVQISTPKTERSQRPIDLDAETVRILRAHKAKQAEEWLALGAGRSGLVFTTETGEWIHPDAFGNIFERLGKSAGVPRIRFHDCRHTFASLALAAGVNVLVVSKRLGHSSVAFTLDVYGHEMPGEQIEAAERVARIIYGTP